MYGRSKQVNPTAQTHAQTVGKQQEHIDSTMLIATAYCWIISKSLKPWHHEWYVLHFTL